MDYVARKDSRYIVFILGASSQFALEGFVENGGQERGEFGSGLSLKFLDGIHFGLQAVEVGHDSTLLCQRRHWDRNLPKVIQVQFR